MNTLKFGSNCISDVFNVLFPGLCMGCGESYTEQKLCLPCLQDLRLTNFTSLEDNYTTRFFEGRVELQSAVSLMYFNDEDSIEQHLLHKLKYRGYKDLGVFFADYLCALYNYSPWGRSIDLVVPIPSYKLRFLKRGYNQVAGFAKRLANNLGVRYEDTILKKIKKSKSQAKKGHWDRWHADKNVFYADRNKLHKYPHILLVDDLITTGNTIQDAYNALRGTEKMRISIASIFVTKS